jgi:hypothetical protein
MTPEILEMFRQHIESGYMTPNLYTIGKAMGKPVSGVYPEFYKAAKLLNK